MTTDLAPFEPIDTLAAGTIFLHLDGEGRMLGIVTRYDGGDRGPGSVDVQYEDGSKSLCIVNLGSTSRVFVLGKVDKDKLKHPLRTLLNWAGEHGG